MLHRCRLVFVFVALALVSVAGIRAEESDEAERAPFAAAEPGEDDGPPSTLPLATFQAAVAKVKVERYQRMPELSFEGDHGLILVGPEEKGLMIMAQRAGIGAKLEKGAAGKLSGFKHKGRDAFFAQMTDDDGEAMAFIVVKYPEHNMGLFVSGKPVTSRAELMKLLAQVEL